MVAFNVIAQSPAHFHKATEGYIALQQHPALESVRTQLEHSLNVKWFRDMQSVQYSKLLMNLNNPINALSNLPLREELALRRYRLQLSQCINEGLQVYKAAGIKTVTIGKVPVHWLARLLKVPDCLFRLLAASMLKISPEARSSMWHDLQQQKPTEIDDLNGEIIRLGETYHIDTPANREVYRSIKLREENLQKGSKKS